MSAASQRRGRIGEATADRTDWRTIVATGVVAGDLSERAVARHANVSTAVAADALEDAHRAGVLGPDGELLVERSELVGRLSTDRVAAIHAEVALHLLRAGPDHVAEVLLHARAAPTVDQSELARLAAASGRLALAGGDPTTAEQLLHIAVELTPEDTGVDRARLLLDLARATRSSGRITAARELLSEVVALAELAGDVDLAVDAAVGSALPPDWRAGDRRTAALLDVAERLDDGSRTGAILAARAMVEMRIPVPNDLDQQIAWVTRASVAQPLADRALELTHGHQDTDRLLALIGWRSTHRSPEFIDGRLQTSRDAVDLSQRLLLHDRLVDSAVTLAVDCLEVGDRSGYERAIATLRWAAETDGNPRLLWWASTTAAGAALIDGDVALAQRHRADALRIGEHHDLPGWVAAEILLAAEIAVDAGDPDGMRRFTIPSDDPMLDSPIARSTVALMCALLGEPTRALHEARLVRRWLDHESSYLLCLTLLARATSTIGAEELATELRPLLEPWSGHVAVDPSGWWCHGPVDLALAELAVVLDDAEDVERRLAAAEATVHSTGDVRSAARIVDVRTRAAGGAGGTAPSGLELLSARETEVLRLIAQGKTNAVIGIELSYSASTIRADTVSIYRKLGVTGRAEAAAVAVASGLARPIE